MENFEEFNFRSNNEDLRARRAGKGVFLFVNTPIPYFIILLKFS